MCAISVTVLREGAAPFLQPTPRWMRILRYPRSALQLGCHGLEHGPLTREPACLQLGVDLFATDHDLERPSRRGYEGDLADVALVGIQQFARQTGGPGEIPSRDAARDLDPLGHGYAP